MMTQGLCDLLISVVCFINTQLHDSVKREEQLKRGGHLCLCSMIFTQWSSGCDIMCNDIIAINHEHGKDTAMKTMLLYAYRL